MELQVTYRLSGAGSGDALKLARAIAREQTVEVPPGVGGEALEARMLGRLESVEPATGMGWDQPRSAPNRHATPHFHAGIAYPLASTGTELTQILNVVYGNVALMNGVRVVDLTLPDEILFALPGPRLGIGGIRALTGATGRPLVGGAIKPFGLSPTELARLAATFARARVDVIKDDHGPNDQPTALGPMRPALPTPAGGMKIDAVAGTAARYGPDTLLLIGGSLLMQKDLEGAAHRLVEAAAHAGEARA